MSILVRYLFLDARHFAPDFLFIGKIIIYSWSAIIYFLLAGQVNIHIHNVTQFML